MLGADPNPKDVTLPPARERQWLIEQTATLLEGSGWRPYVLAPLLAPTPTYFPDRWAGGDRSVIRILRRLLRYAGHDEAAYAVEVTIHDADPARRGEVKGKPPVMRGSDPTAWFVGRDQTRVAATGKQPERESGTLRFSVEEHALREPENLVPALARAVAQAHRALAGLATPEGMAGERLVDLTTFMLGFGLLTTDASQRFYAKSDGGFRTSRAQFRLGALSVQDMSFLLALQAVARGLDGRGRRSRKERRHILRHLQPNQAGFFREAETWLVSLKPPARARLGIPAAEQWPAAFDLDALTGPLGRPGARPERIGGPELSGVYGEEGEEEDEDEYEGEDEDDEGDEDEEEERRDLDRGIRDANRGKVVFRVERSGALRMAKILGFPVLMLGGLFSRGNMGIEVPMEIVAPTAACLAVAGLAIGALFTDRRCSEPKCGNKLKVEDEVCPLCGGVVMGVIHGPKERLGAEEELVRKGKISPDGLVLSWRDPNAPMDSEDDEDSEDDD
ncbi:hypothetical protein PPSIR1_18682 [Plesiocystis pacifica SIR-1]|uniref:Uncharacterized protein n=1 Tax=Plesiocystis pacifica SIR-1 TaxID=391625 RepID=A6GBF2_9BACT|nr:hypothetical protein [Plesiocystis pacifica]EDM76756.1 hypothetical protein PPSIR1_18682 [Plesiocystis pacifica SIR-1]